MKHFILLLFSLVILLPAIVVSVSSLNQKFDITINIEESEEEQNNDKDGEELEETDMKLYYHSDNDLTKLTNQKILYCLIEEDLLIRTRDIFLPPPKAV